MKIINRLSSLIIVQMKCDTVGQGFHFLMPVEVNGITKDMIIRKNTPLHGGSAKDLPFGRSEACLLRPESTPMCSAVLTRPEICLQILLYYFIKVLMFEDLS